MNLEFSYIELLENSGYRVSFILAIVHLTFLSYWFTIKSTWFENLCNRMKKEDTTNYLQISMSRILGFIILGILPVLIILLFTNYKLVDLGLLIDKNTIQCSLIWTIALSSIIVVLNFLNSRSTIHLKQYPQVRMKYWTYRRIGLNMSTWMIYLIGYEVLFRGILLFPLYYVYGMWPAVTIGTIIYSLIHIPKGKTEAIGAIPLGIILGLLTLHYGHIYIALVAHIVMAISNFLFSLMKHPNMQLKS